MVRARAFVNAVVYLGRGETIDEGFVVFQGPTIEEVGPPFDPRHLPEPDLSLPLEQRRAGGMGVHLVLQMVDHLDYRSDGGKNCLQLEVAIRQDSGDDRSQTVE